MAGSWARVKKVLAEKLCIGVPPAVDGPALMPPPPPAAAAAAAAAVPVEVIPGSPASGKRLSRSDSKSSKKICTICLGSMKPGHGQALFTAECSHTFHFHCISSNVKHGNFICPVCRATWKEIPFHNPPVAEVNHGRARVSPLWPQDDGHMAVARRFPRIDTASRQPQLPLFQTPEPRIYNDDEWVNLLLERTAEPLETNAGEFQIRTFTEFSAVQRSSAPQNFGVLIHLKAPHSGLREMPSGNTNGCSAAALFSNRTPLDLVTVLDISGSMAGTKIALLKRAMSFVIQNLGASDRLSVVAFSSTARRLFHLKQMTESGKQHALQAVNSLIASGGTNIADGLRKGAKVLEDRRIANPVCSIILLSDGQDTYTLSTSSNTQPNYNVLIPSYILEGTASHQVPIHTFGFGSDHDSDAMHSIAENSRGTFSFIEAEASIQDAFAQCIGGLLSVIVQDVQLTFDCIEEGVLLSSIKSGSYESHILEGGRVGSIKVGDLYADEEKDFLVNVNVPPAQEQRTVLLKVGCTYTDTIANTACHTQGEDVVVERTEHPVTSDMSIQVDRERNRVLAAEDMATARAAAERGALSEAVRILEERKGLLADSLAARSGDHLCLALDAELHEMLERLQSRQRYESSGRAYMLSGLSSHSWQRATARGDSTELTSLVHAYQTPSMVDMLQRSQTLLPSPPAPLHPVRPPRSASGRQRPGSFSFI